MSSGYMSRIYMKMFSARSAVCVGIIIVPRYDAAVNIRISLLPDIFTIYRYHQM